MAEAVHGAACAGENNTQYHANDMASQANRIQSPLRRISTAKSRLGNTNMYNLVVKVAHMTAKSCVRHPLLRFAVVLNILIKAYLSISKHDRYN